MPGRLFVSSSFPFPSIATTCLPTLCDHRYHQPEHHCLEPLASSTASAIVLSVPVEEMYLAMSNGGIPLALRTPRMGRSEALETITGGLKVKPPGWIVCPKAKALFNLILPRSSSTILDGPSP